MPPPIEWALKNLLEELRLCPNRPRGGRLEAAELAARQALGAWPEPVRCDRHQTESFTGCYLCLVEAGGAPDPLVPRWESIVGPDGVRTGVRAVCEPEGYCKDGHRCGQLDLGLRRDSQLNTRNDLQIFAEQFSEIHGQGITAVNLADAEEDPNG